jgi:hypothetical protein
MRDDETESYREEQGKTPRPDPRERQGEVPIAFSTGGVLRSGADDGDARADEAEVVAESADATAAVERGARAIEAERRTAAGDARADGDQARPSARS